MTAAPPAGSATAELLARYDRPGPRYTSYPTAVEFHDGFTEADYRERLAEADRRSAEPLSLYAHLPFCEERCLFCACNVIVTRHREVAADYLDRLVQEIDLLAAHIPKRRMVSQMHWGGGTPTYYAPTQLERLFRAISRHFRFTPDADIGIEADPRVTTDEHVDTLRRLGFNRLSLGVQDFTPEVQSAVNRIQGVEQTSALVARARASGFSSVNLDLIFGLPHQSVATFARTLDQVLTIRPDRLAVYSFAYVPWIKGHMKRIPDAALPSSALKLELLALAIETFTQAGYRQIGMDHFALPEDDLARAADTGALYRNFMGYSVRAAPDLVGVGISAIGDVAGAFAQNTKKLSEYARAVLARRFPTERGYALSLDDLRRREVITQLMCAFRVDFAGFADRFGISFADYFGPELAELQSADGPVAHGLIELGDDGIVLTARGRPFVRTICMTFDGYLRRRAASPQPVFSRTV
ncbi:MAG: oxygen-independent coproporphyrinogen III oxidase [Gemmatimonadales bacterium]